MTLHLTKTTSMDAFLVPPPADSDADADSAATEPTDSDATEHAAEPDENNDASNRDEDGNATEKAEHGVATEHTYGDPSAVTREPRTKKTANADHCHEQRAGRRCYRARRLS